MKIAADVATTVVMIRSQTPETMTLQLKLQLQTVFQNLGTPSLPCPLFPVDVLFRELMEALEEIIILC